MAKMIRKDISNEIKSASKGLFSLEVDETKDLQKVEQIAIIVRYAQNADPTEELL